MKKPLLFIALLFTVYACDSNVKEETLPPLALEEAASIAVPESEPELVIKEEEKSIKITLENVLFDFNKFTITKRGQELLREVVQILLDRPTAIIHIEGHSDNRGTKKSKEHIAERRAHSVSSFLIKHGVEKERVTFKGMSDKNPLKPNTTKENRAKNRRVELDITK